MLQPQTNDAKPQPNVREKKLAKICEKQSPFVQIEIELCQSLIHAKRTAAHHCARNKQPFVIVQVDQLETEKKLKTKH